MHNLLDKEELENGEEYDAIYREIGRVKFRKQKIFKK